MRYVILVATFACVAAFGLDCSSQVPSDLEDYGQVVGQSGYDIGIKAEEDEKVEACPVDKADTLVVYSATWCGPCQAMKPYWVTLRAQGYKVVYIDVDNPHKYDGKWDYQTSDFVTKCDLKEVKAVPTLRYYNSSTGEWLDKEVRGLTSLTNAKALLWKPSGTGSLPELLR